MFAEVVMTTAMEKIWMLCAVMLIVNSGSAVSEFVPGKRRFRSYSGGHRGKSAATSGDCAGHVHLADFWKVTA
jgi:hypothetical protein